MTLLHKILFFNQHFVESGLINSLFKHLQVPQDLVNLNDKDTSSVRDRTDSSKNLLLIWIVRTTEVLRAELLANIVQGGLDLNEVSDII